MQNRLALLAIPAALAVGTAIAQDNAQPEPAPLQYDEVWEAWTPSWSSSAPAPGSTGCLTRSKASGAISTSP